jgi:hypothetical protein
LIAEHAKVRPAPQQPAAQLQRWRGRSNMAQSRERDMAKIEEGDEVLVRGEVVWIEGDNTYRIQFPGYPYPIYVYESAIERVFKQNQPRDKPD